MAEEKKYKLLLIEDDLFVRDLYVHGFKKDGFEIDAVENVANGVKLATENSYDMILLDIMLPDGNGIDVLKQLKEDSHPQKDTPVFMLTNLGQEEIMRQAYELGAKGYFLKSNTLPDSMSEKINDFFAANPPKP